MRKIIERSLRQAGLEMGEICNLLAETWKSKVPDLAATCGLSVAAEITGSDSNLHVQSPEFRICQTRVRQHSVRNDDGLRKLCKS
jgi:hypothetical protein